MVSGNAHDREHERQRPARRPARRADERLSAPAAARMGMEDVRDLTGREPLGVVSVEPADDGWQVGVEVVEERRIPSSADMLALYTAEISADGDLLSCRRDRRYLRGSTDAKAG